MKPADEQRPKRVLILDDDARILETAAELLRRGGFEVITYKEEFNRLNFVAEAGPDLVLLDVNMPFLPGDELFGLFQDYPALRDIPVFFFSSNDERDLRRLVLQTGAAGYVSKSELGLNFSAKIARLLERPHKSA